MCISRAIIKGAIHMTSWSDVLTGNAGYVQSWNRCLFLQRGIPCATFNYVIALAKKREHCWRETTGSVALCLQISKGNLESPWWKWRTVTANAVPIGHEEVMQEVHNLRSWARGWLTGIGTVFEVDLEASDGPSPVQSHAIKSHHCWICVTVSCLHTKTEKNGESGQNSG